MTDEPTHVSLEIKLNNAASNDPCEICGARTDPEVGPELFLAGSWALVCYECGDKYAPELLRCLLEYRNSYRDQQIDEIVEAQYALECVIARLSEDELRRILEDLPPRALGHVRLTAARF